MVLRGTEVKSLRDHNASIEEAHVRIDGHELWLVGSHIATYPFGQDRNHDPYRRRKLLAHSREIAKLATHVEQKGLTLIALQIYFNDRGIAKITVGIARGMKGSDKRQSMKAKDAKREMDRAQFRRR